MPNKTDPGLQRAVELLGSKAALARALGVSDSALWNMMHRDCKTPADKVLAIYDATGGKLKPHELRPDLYPRRILRRAYC